jgi:hypothetical protein
MRRLFFLCFVGLLLSGPSSFAASAPAASGDGFSLTYDMGVSTGSSGGRSYSEASLGLNAFISDWFVWRNAGFGRFSDATETVYGLDSSARLMADIGDRAIGMTAFVGPGYRFVTRGDSAPFAEAGLTLHAGGLSIGGGAKRVFNSAIRSDAADDTQYFIVLSGSGRID